MVDHGRKPSQGWRGIGVPCSFDHDFVLEVGQAGTLDFVEFFEFLADVGVLEWG